MRLRDLELSKTMDKKTIALLVINFVMIIFFMVLFARIFLSTGDSILASPQGGGAMVNKDDDPTLAWFFFLFMEGFFLSLMGVVLWAFRRELRKR